MRYAAGLFYALAIAAHSGALLNTLVLGALVFAGVVATIFALEAIVRDAVAPVRNAWTFPFGDVDGLAERRAILTTAQRDWAAADRADARRRASAEMQRTSHLKGNHNG